MIESKLKERKNELQFTLQSENINYQWATFAIINLLDVISTLEGLEYNCIYEGNPLFKNNRRPHRDALLIHKLIFVPLIVYPQSHYWSDNDIQAVNVFVGNTVIENQRIRNKAKSRSDCQKIN